jgi:hypothetical protein
MGLTCESINPILTLGSLQDQVEDPDSLVQRGIRKSAFLARLLKIGGGSNQTLDFYCPGYGRHLAEQCARAIQSEPHTVSARFDLRMLSSC